MHKPIRSLVVGLGHIGSRHVRLLAAHSAFVLVGGVDPDAATWAVLPEGVPALADVEAAAALESELVCICTPNGLHVEQARWAVRTGAHAVVEKPFGLQADRCRTLIREAREAGRHLFCVLQNRYSPPARLLKHLLAEGRLGRLHEVQVSCTWNRDDRYYRPGSWRGSLALDGGPLYTQFSHFLDLLVWLVGPLEVEAARFFNDCHRATTEFEDGGHLWLRGLDDVRVSFSYSTAAWNRNFESRIVLRGSRGIICAGGQYMERIDYAHIEDWTPPEIEGSPPPNRYGGWQGSADNHAHVFENVAQTLRGNARPDADGPDALRTVELIERMYRLRPAEVMGRRVLAE
jgi:predicted dehydrogenase